MFTGSWVGIHYTYKGTLEWSNIGGNLLHTDNCILHALYISSVNDANNGRQNWVSKCKALLYSFGFGDVWENQTTIEHSAFVCIFKQRVIDCFLQKWRSDIQDSNIMPFYKHIQPNFEFARYLDIVRNVTWS